MSNYFANDMNQMADSIKANITVGSVPTIFHPFMYNVHENKVCLNK